jgi:hypothetical protein
MAERFELGGSREVALGLCWPAVEFDDSRFSGQWKSTI